MSVVRRILPRPEPSESRFLSDLLRSEALGGMLALAAAVVAVVWANSPWDASYHALISRQLGPLDLEHWGADGALTLFFFVAGLELKREFVVGSLRRPADAAVPVAAALCGVAVPAIFYTVVNVMAPQGQTGGWAIPAATDIAFALAVLSVVGAHLPASLRAFLLTLAVVDDLIVIVVIAVFYTSTLHLVPLAVAVAAFAAWAVLQRLRVRTPLLYVPLALLAWWCVHDSGIHATIAGVVVAGGGALLRDPVVVGVVVGLVLGKPVGVLAGTWLVTTLTRAELNEELSWRDVVGVAVLAGVGFTVALLVADLSYTGPQAEDAKTAVLAGSVVAALLAALVLGRRSRVHRRSAV